MSGEPMLKECASHERISNSMLGELKAVTISETS